MANGVVNVAASNIRDTDSAPAQRASSAPTASEAMTMGIG
jgi:hypothetical protein